MIAQEMTNKIESVLKKHDVSFAGVFGSRARGRKGLIAMLTYW